MSYYVGIDLGGTNIKAGIVNDKGEIVCKDKMKTFASREPVEIVRDMAALATKVIGQAKLKIEDVEAIGIGSPGTPDNDTGYLIYANNLPFNNLPMRSEIRKYVDLPVYIDNDANVAALAESVSGGAAGASNAVAITLGTGVGGGVVINRRIYSGFNHAGCEIGHMVVKAGGEYCTCGRRGCIEAYSSASALVRDTMRAAKNNPDSVLNRLIAENGGEADGRTAFIAMREGDAAAKVVVDNYIEMLAEAWLTSLTATCLKLLLLAVVFAMKAMRFCFQCASGHWKKLTLRQAFRRPGSNLPHWAMMLELLVLP
jgi:glucokinase